MQPLYRSWQQYMQELLAPGVQDVEARLYGADLHGCLIRVSAMLGGHVHGMQWKWAGEGGRVEQAVMPPGKPDAKGPRFPACLPTRFLQNRGIRVCGALWCGTQPTRCSWSRLKTDSWLCPSG